MPDLKGILHEVIVEKRLQFAGRFNKFLQSKKEYSKYGARREIAAFCGVNEMTVQHWINGRTFPRNEFIKKLAEYFGLPVQEFLGKELAKYYKEDES